MEIQKREDHVMNNLDIEFPVVQNKDHEGIDVRVSVINNISKDISALYGILMIISAACLTPLSEYVDFFDDGFLRYLETVIFSMGLAFLLFSFVFLFRPPTSEIICGPGESPPVVGPLHWFRLWITWKPCMKLDSEISARNQITVTRKALNSGSFYLKIGCMIFAVGSMIYVCTILGIVIENTHCFEAINTINQCLIMSFIILQLFFIFRNSQFTITKYRAIIGRFGLMHLAVTDILMCIRCIVDETLHEFQELTLEHNSGAHNHTSSLDNRHTHASAKTQSGTGTGAYVTSCISEGSIMPKVLVTVMPLLYPCIIEYGLISAGILFTMWRNIGLGEDHEEPAAHNGNEISLQTRTTYRIDCDQALMGLFGGLVVVALTVVGLILFTLAIGEPIWKNVAIIDWHIMNLVLSGVGVVSVVYCYVQIVRKLQRIEISSINGELDYSLLLVAMMGVYAYCVVTLMGSNGGSSSDLNTNLSRANASVTLIQTTLQTIFLFDASKRVPSMRISKEKPAKQVLTFLLVLNFALWAVNILCTLHTDGTPNQRDFFGEKEWTVMLHVTVPLVIFYRFHSTFCIFEVWKRAYKQ